MNNMIVALSVFNVNDRVTVFRAFCKKPVLYDL